MPLFGPPDVAQLKAKSDIQGLIRALGYTGDVNVRRAAAAALGELGDARAVEPLTLALKNPNWEHDWNDTAAAADALVRLGAPSVGPLISVLGYHSKVVRVAAAGALAAIGRPAVEPLIELLGDPDLENRETAVQMLAEIGADAVDKLIEALNDESGGRRLRAAKVLGEIGDPRAVEPLGRALREPLAGVRQQAARSLGEIADPRSAGPLVAALGDSDPSVRITTALALAAMKNPRAVPTLLPELRGTGWQVAADGLVKVGVPAAEPMVAMLAESKARGDETWLIDDLRSEISGVLARIGYPERVARLVTELFAENDKVVSHAASELIRLSQSGALDAQTKQLIRAAMPAAEPPSEGQPAEGADQPPEGADQPPEGADQPPEGADQPPEGADQPAEGADQPAEGADQPAEGADQPPEGADQPPEGGDQPD